MIVQALAFYLFAGVTLFSALMVIMARNPVNSVLFLILAFFNAAGLFVLLGAEFVAMILVIVYVGAVAVLFLFVVMMLDVSFDNLRKGAMQYVPIGLVIGGILMAELVSLYGAWTFFDGARGQLDTPLAAFGDVQNTMALSQVLYTDYIFAFQIAGLVLFVAMIGSIVLTHRKRSGVRKQSITQQHSRQVDDVLEVHKVTPGTGI